jgi:hypothetical protein
MKKRYGIAFDTKEFFPKIKVVTVKIGMELMGPEDKMDIDLADHPDYHHLEDYVRNNPRKYATKK